MDHDVLVRLTAAVICCACAACAAGPRTSPPARMLRMFGPAVGNEVITGRAEETDGRGPISLVVGERTLVTLDLDTRTVQRYELALPVGVTCWGLARLNDGSLWTLEGRRTLAEILPDGRIARELPLPESSFGLFGNGDRLVYQPADFLPPGPALRTGRPGEPLTTAWGTLQTRPFPMARAAVAALNLLSCGTGRSSERPCWFPDEAAVTLVDASGRMRRIELAGLTLVPPEILLTSENPPRPVRDAYIDETGSLWIISSGSPPPGAAAQSGGWILAHYGAAGEPLGQVRLASAARLILRVDRGVPVLLASSGDVVEARP